MTTADKNLLLALVAKWRIKADYEDYASAGPHIYALRDCATDLEMIVEHTPAGAKE